MSRRVLLILTALLLLAALLLFLFLRFLGPLPRPGEAGTLTAPRTPAPANRILDRNGLLLYEIIDPAVGKHTPVPLAQIAPSCQDAVIATEDKRFYQHPGVDLIAIARSAWANWREGGVIQGGSTLTQQLARILWLGEDERYEQSLRRKLREALLAWRLERVFSKDELLALYLNQVYFGHFAAGIEAAAQAYFGRPAADLDLAQCALLAGLPQAPALYNPIEHPQAAATRQAQVLQRMVEMGMIDPAEAAAAAAEPLHFATTPFPIAAPHFVFFVAGQMEGALGQERLARGGLTIETTLDLPLQAQAEASIRRRLAELNAPGRDGMAQRRVENAALVGLSVADGSILLFIGSPDYFDARISGAVNGALALRQPGSALKPVTYAVALDPGLSAAAGRAPLTPATVLADVPTRFPTREGVAYRPLNYDLAFRGPVSARVALANSLNIPAVRVLQTIGIPALVTQAQRQGISTLASPHDYGLALTLGGGEVRLLELTAAYLPLVRAGLTAPPLAISRIRAGDEVLFDAGLDGGKAINPAGWDLPLAGAGAAVLDPRAAYLITHILSDNDARAPAFGYSSPLRLPDGRPAAAKTGTTTDWRDNWTIGYTPDLAVGVWVGNADNSPMIGVSGIDGAAPIWHDVMILAHKNRAARAFPRPPGLVEVAVCAPSGLLPTPACPQIGRELFIAGTEPTRPDDQHRRIAIDTRTGLPADAGTPQNALASRIAWAPPPELRAWAQEQGMLLLDETPLSTTLPRESAGLALQEPQPDAHYLLDPRLPAGAQQLRLAIVYSGADPLTSVRYYLDGAAIAETHAWPWLAWWPLQVGAHEVAASARTRGGQTLHTAAIPFTVIAH